VAREQFANPFSPTTHGDEHWNSDNTDDLLNALQNSKLGGELCFKQNAASFYNSKVSPYERSSKHYKVEHFT
jgi:methyl coenzyme M reductase gamma subunit